jgi:nitroimidazol reductase NimA-like FMN-containing flavoprotein (pyridoxamine 5'-phosphate oxidase superfamily)
MLRALERGVPVCVTVTLLDGLVLARSAFRHSMNYRSVVVLGFAHAVTDGTEKRAALEAIVNHVVPGRAAAVRPPSAEEMRATLVLRVPLDEVSAKVRSGPPHDLDEDVALPCWAGELPLRLAALSPVVAPDCVRSLPPPAAITPYGRAGA